MGEIRAIVSNPCVYGNHGLYAVCSFKFGEEIVKATFSLADAWTEERNPFVGEEVIATEPIKKSAGWRFLHVRPFELSDVYNSSHEQ